MDDPLYFLPQEETVYWSGQPAGPVGSDKSSRVFTLLFGIIWIVIPMVVGIVNLLLVNDEPFVLLFMIPFVSIFVAIGVIVIRTGTKQINPYKRTWYVVTDQAVYCSDENGWYRLEFKKGMAAYANTEEADLKKHKLGTVTTLFGAEQMEFYGIQDAADVCSIINDAIEEVSN